MTELEKSKFDGLCRDDLFMHGTDADGIGTYNEKRLHRIIKRYITSDASCYEVKVGKSVADVLLDGRVYEIQTSSFRPLERKIENYLENTDLDVTVIRPIVAQKTIIRADRETGEVMYSKKSPKKESLCNVLPQMYYLRNFIKNARVEVRILSVSAEEYRYSERVRYRKSGAYDKDLRPVELFDELSLRGADAYRDALPTALLGGEFTAAEFSKATRLRGRNASLALAFLVYTGIAQKRTEGKRNFYKIK